MSRFDPHRVRSQESLEQELTRLRKHNEELGTTILSLREENRDLWQKRNDLVQEVGDLRAELASLSDIIADLPDHSDLDAAQFVLNEKAAELARLREENEKLKSWFRESEGHRDYWRWREGKRTSAKDAEIARLREVEKAARHVAKVAANGAYLSQKDWLRLVDALNPPPEQISRNALKETT